MSKESGLKRMDEIPPSIVLRQMTNDYWTSQCLYVVAKLGIADLLKDSPKASVDLARATNTDARSLYRLMRALVSIGVFTMDEKGSFGLTPIGKYLQTEISVSMRARTIMHGEEMYQAWGHLLHSVKTGQSAFKNIFGMSHFEYLSQNPQAAETFDQAMANLAPRWRAFADNYDFSGMRKIVDIGGGYGGLIASILQRNRTMKGVLFDLPHVIKGARSFIESEGLAHRCELIGGDFFQTVPEGGDAYILSGAIHNWNDDDASKILNNCRSAMEKTSRLLILQTVIPPGNEPFWGKFEDLHMMVIEGGCERTEEEFRELFSSTGFRLTNIILTQVTGFFSVIEGVPM